MRRSTTILCLCLLMGCGVGGRRGGRSGSGGGDPGDGEGQVEGAGGEGLGEGADDANEEPPDEGAEGGGGDEGEAGEPDVIVPPVGGDPCGDEGAAQNCGGPILGTCDPGWRWCVAGEWTDCEQFVGPVAESCDGLDNDCDGTVDGEENGCAPFDDGDPDALSSQIEALDRMNEHRAAAGLPIVRFHPALNRAATNHAEYHRQNGGAHGEDRGRPGFTGANPGARAAYEDYDGPGALYEDMAFGLGPAGSIDTWFHSVYHRIPIVRPDAALIGFGSYSDAEVLDVAMDGSHRGIHAFTPYDGQEEVPRNFHSNREGPDPVPGEGEVGYPISVITAHRDVRLIEASVVTDAGEDLDLHLATSEGPHQGFLTDSVFLMPVRSMDEDTWHTVRMTYRAGGETHQRTWRFKTGSRRFR